MSDLFPPPGPFKSVTPGYSVVLPDGPKKSGVLVALTVVGLAAAVVLIVGIVLLTRGSDRVSPFVDSQAATTASPTTSTILLVPGEVEFLSSRSAVAPGNHRIDLSGLTIGQCFDIAEGSEIERKDCGLPHFFQLYAVGELPAGLTKSAKVHQFYLDFCASEFAEFVGVSGVYSPFFASGSYPADWQLPGERTVTCYIYAPGVIGWTGTAEGSGELKIGG